MLDNYTREKVLELIASGKGVIPYEKITDFNSLEFKPEDGVFLEKLEFVSESKQAVLGDEEFENSEFLFLALKMRNLSEINDLYNFQDVCLLCETVENLFESMHKLHGFNQRRCNSASALSGCIERNISKVTLTLPTNGETEQIFEKTLTEEFSCINT